MVGLGKQGPPATACRRSRRVPWEERGAICPCQCIWALVEYRACTLPMALCLPPFTTHHPLPSLSPCPNPGIRKAGPGDLDAIISLLRPLEEAGILVSRSREDMANLLQVWGCWGWVGVCGRVTWSVGAWVWVYVGVYECVLQHLH